MGPTLRLDATKAPARRWLVRAALTLILLAQAFLGFQQSADLLTRGHNGWNTGAYQQAARNTLRFGQLFPVQYYTGVAPPKPSDAYTHAPLGLHLNTTLSVWLFGDEEGPVRGVAAVYGIFAALMIFFVTRRLWGDLHAIVAGVFYVAMPINGIYVNMSNHASGLIAWGLLTFYCYFRFHDLREAGVTDPAAQPGARRWFVALCASYFMMATWEWASNYTAFAIALHWLYAGAKRQMRAGKRWYQPGSDVGMLSIFSTVVLGFLALHALLVELYAGGLGEMHSTFNKRQEASPAAWAYHLRTVPEYMFSWPMLMLAGLWLLALFARAVRGKLNLRDLVPFTFAYGGIIHYLLFKRSAVVHEYWGWLSVPFFAIACAVAWLWFAEQLAELGKRAMERFSNGANARYGAVLALCAVPVLFPFATRVVEIVPMGRMVAGALWHMGPVRRPNPTMRYESSRPELLFAKQIRARTTRNTGVLRHNSLKKITASPRWSITVDRELRWVAAPPATPPISGPKDGWVFVSTRRAFARPKIVELASRHPYYQHGDFFMLDLRESRIDVQALRLKPGPMTASHWFWQSPFEPPLFEEHVTAAEAQLTADASALAARSAVSAPSKP